MRSAVSQGACEWQKMLSYDYKERHFSLYPEVALISKFSIKMGDKVSMKISLVESARTREMLVYLSSTVLNSFTSKGKLLAFILNDVFEEPITVDEAYTKHCRIERKSKRHKKFVPLEFADDFKELLRSLRVKKHLKLVVYLKDEPIILSENPLFDAIEQIKKISSELQKSELWELLKSLTSKIDSDHLAFDATVSDANKNSSPQEKVMHQHVLCDSCHPHDDTEQIRGTRYKCMDCENFDLCEKCYLSKVSVFNHVPSHVMLAIPKPVNHDNFRFLCSGKIRNDRCVDSAGPKKYNNETTIASTLPVTSKSQDFEKVLIQSSSYEELLSLIPDEEKNKFNVIRSLIESKYRDVDTDKDELSFGFLSSEGKTRLVMDNKSSVVLPQGKFLLKFQKEDNLDQSLELEASSDIPPGGVTPFEVEFLDPTIFNGANVSFVHSNGTIALEGKCFPMSISDPDVRHLDVQSVVTPNEANKTEQTSEADLAVTVIPKGKLLSLIAIINKGESPFNTGNLVIKIVNCFQSVVALVTVGSKHAIPPGRVAKFNVPINNTHFKFPFRVVVESANFSLSCGLSLKHLSGVLSQDKEQINSQEQEDPQNKIMYSADKGQSLEVESTAKDDEVVELVETASSDDSIKSNDFSEAAEETNREKVKNDENRIEEANDLIALEDKEENRLILDSTLSSCEEAIQSEVHQNSLISPSMPLKLLNSNFDTANEEFVSGELSEKDDYDVISIGDAEEVPSDYEVLSCTNSYEV